MKLAYLLINFFSVIVPFIFSFHPKIKFYKFFKEFFLANVITVVCFVIWDSFFTSWGVWGFSDNYTLGIRIFGMPIEEILFFICIPFACLFTYHCLNTFFKIEWNEQITNIIIGSLSLVLLILGIIHYDKLYTTVTFISTGILLLILQFLLKVNWLPKFISIYPIILIPFFIVNGLLTGSWLSEPIVWYNDEENLSIRMFTIPVEDAVYGFELLIFNLFFYEKFKNTKLES